MDDPYQVLGVARDADADEIKAAYRKLALRYHPDRNPGDTQAEERFKRISEAYATLRDPAQRARFDRFGPDQPQGRPDFSNVDWHSVFREADVRVAWQEGMPRTGNAVFDALFGVMTGMFRNAGLLPGEHRQVTLELDLDTARRGGERAVRIPGPSVCPACRGGKLAADGTLCPECGGRGVLPRGGAVEVRVPPRIRPGTKLRLKGLGGPGQPPGDAVVALQVHLPQGVHRQGNDLYAELPITPLEARSGVRSRRWGVAIDVPAGTADGQALHVAGGGLAGGDLWVTVRHDVWRGLGRRLLDWWHAAAAAVEGPSGGAKP